MQQKKRASLWLGLAAAVLTVFMICVSLGNRNAKPVLVFEDPEARRQTVELLAAVGEGGFSEAGSFFFGQPDLSRFLPEDDALVQQLLSQGWRKMRWSISPACKADGTTLTAEVTLSTIPAGKVLSSLEPYVQKRVQEAVADAADTSALVDENGKYKESFLQQMKTLALQDALDDCQTIQKTVTVRIGREDGQWRIVPEEAIMDALTCWITKPEYGA